MIRTKSNPGSHAFKAFLVAVCLFLLLPASGSAIVIKPGKLDHLVIEVAGRPVAGETFNVGVKVYDSHNNLIADYDRTGRDIQVSVTGSASAAPSVLKAASFSSGSASVRLQDEKAEDITLAFYEADIKNPLVSVAIRVLPNKLDHFTLDAPGSVIAGEAFKVMVTARDRFGNVVADASTALSVQSLGTTGLEDVVAPEFVGGVSAMSAVARKTGRVAVEVSDPGASVKGRSGEVEVAPAALDHFNVAAPSEAEAGKPFTMVLTAYDRFGNIREGYGASGNGVRIASSGGAEATPSYVGPSEFKKGSATVSLIYTKSEDITLTATEKDGTQKGKSASVAVRPAAPDHFRVSTPDEATAGETFRVKIEAYDRFENLIRDYDRVGQAVNLKASGSGKLTPETVEAGKFANGAAAIDVHYDRAESISISASLSPAAGVAPRPAGKAAQAPERKPEKPVEPLSKAAPAQPEKKAVEERPAKLPPKEVVKGEKVFAVKNIKLVEAGPRVLVVIEVPGMTSALRYEEALESVGGKDWIRLRLTPAESEISKALSFESDLVGEVRVKDDPKVASTDVLIEILPKKVQYSVKRDEGMIIVDVLRLGAAR